MSTYSTYEQNLKLQGDDDPTLSFLGLEVASSFWAFHWATTVSHRIRWQIQRSILDELQILASMHDGLILL